MCASYDPWLIEKMQKENALKKAIQMLSFNDLIEKPYIQPQVKSFHGSAPLGGPMNVCLVDKNHKFNPSNFSSTIVAKIEIEVDNEEDLMNLLKHIQGIDPKSLQKSGVVPSPGIPPKIKLAVKKPDSPDIPKDEKPSFGPISTLEIE